MCNDPSIHLTTDGKDPKSTEKNFVFKTGFEHMISNTFTIELTDHLSVVFYSKYLISYIALCTLMKQKYGKWVHNHSSCNCYQTFIEYS